MPIAKSKLQKIVASKTASVSVKVLVEFRDINVNISLDDDEDVRSIKSNHPDIKSELLENISYSMNMSKSDFKISKIDIIKVSLYDSPDHSRND